jgi:hypothetical protein
LIDQAIAIIHNYAIAVRIQAFCFKYDFDHEENVFQLTLIRTNTQIADLAFVKETNRVDNRAILIGEILGRLMVVDQV